MGSAAAGQKSELKHQRTRQEALRGWYTEYRSPPFKPESRAAGQHSPAIFYCEPQQTEGRPITSETPSFREAGPFQTKTDKVFDALKDAIITGELKPGDWIRNTDWAVRLHVSPIPVREALRRLEAQGLVEFGAHKGARVTSQTEAHVEETYLLRIALESLAARLALENISDEAFGQLVDRVEELTRTIESHIRVRNMAAALSTNYEIHMAVYSASHRPRLVSMIENLWATYPFGGTVWPDGRWDAMRIDHRRFLEVLRQRDSAAMAAETERHLGNARDWRLKLAARPRAVDSALAEAPPA